jgi:outer membrane protein TolC
MKVRLLSSIFILLSIAAAEAQKIYGLKECIETGLENNYSILVAKNSETIANNNYTLGNAGFLPSVGLTGRYNGTSNNTTQNPADGGESTSGSSNSSVMNAAVSLDWTIFSGFSVQANYKKLNELKQLGELNTQISVENLIANIIISYSNYIQQVEVLANLEYAASLSRERLRIDEDRYLLGSSSKLSVLQSRVYLNADSSNLSRQVEVVRAAQIRLNELMTVEDLATEFISEDTTVQVNAGLLYEKLLDETLSGNTRLRIASKYKTVSEYDHKIISARTYPYLNFSSAYSYGKNNYSTGNFESQVTNGMNYGLTLGFNIFDGFNQRRSIKNSSIEIKNQELAYLEIEQGIRADLITIYFAYSNNLRLIKLEEQNLATANENLEIALDRYKLGSLSGIELREVQKTLLDARERLLAIQYQTKLAEISLKMISGKIMDYYL